MSAKDKIVIRVLLLVAKFVAQEEWKKEIDQLASHISYASLEAK